MLGYIHKSEIFTDKITLEDFKTHWKPEFAEAILLPLIAGGKKGYAVDNWLRPDGNTMEHKVNHNSIFHHLSESYAGLEFDHESGLRPASHGACRFALAYTRYARGIKHPKDLVEIHKQKCKELGILKEEKN